MLSNTSALLSLVLNPRSSLWPLVSYRSKSTLLKVVTSLDMILCSREFYLADIRPMADHQRLTISRAESGQGRADRSVHLCAKCETAQLKVNVWYCHLTCWRNAPSHVGLILYTRVVGRRRHLIHTTVSNQFPPPISYF